MYPKFRPGRGNAFGGMHQRVYPAAENEIRLLWFSVEGVAVADPRPNFRGTHSQRVLEKFSWTACAAVSHPFQKPGGRMRAWRGRLGPGKLRIVPANIGWFVYTAESGRAGINPFRYDSMGWTPTDGGRNTAHAFYTYLPPGDYRFMWPLATVMEFGAATRRLELVGCGISGRRGGLSR